MAVLADELAAIVSEAVAEATRPLIERLAVVEAAVAQKTKAGFEAHLRGALHG
jgi:hypothetical protein